MKKLSKILALVLVLMTVLMSVSVLVANAAAGQTWTVAGSKALCGTEWDVNNKNNDMTYDADTDSYVKVFTNVKAGSYEVKCAQNHSWTTSYGNGNNNLSVKVEKDGSTVTITLKGTKVTATVVAPSCDHAYEVTAATVTCLTGGTRTWTCPKCQDTYTETLDALGHHYDATGKCERCAETTELVRVYVDNAAKWTEVYCYTWDTNPYVAWPGEKMTLDTESGLYYYDIPKIFVNVIFNNGSGTQSADLKTPTGTATIYNNSTKAWTAPHVHNYVAGEVVAPTYTAGGYTVYTCSCGLTENRDQTPALEVTFPEAVVTPIENPELTFALNFGIKDLEAIMANEALVEVLFAKYGKMYVDYRLTIEGLTVDSVVFNADGTADGYLGGQYDEWSSDWVYVPFENVTIENGGSIMIMELAAKMMGKDGLRMTLEEIVAIVADFDCGVYFTPEFLAANPGMKVTLELIVFNEENGELVDVINVAKNEFTAPHVHSYEAAVTAPTCEEAGYTTYTCACGDTYTADEVDALGHVYFYNVCLTCYAPNPYFEYNFMVTGTNTVKVNEYHLVDTEGHGFPYQFTTFTVAEDGHYVFSSDKFIGFTIFTIEVNTEGADWTTGTGASWGEYIVGNEVDLKAGTYYVGMIYMGGLGEYQVTIEKAAEECVDHVDADTDYVCDNCGAELERPVDPDPVDPVDPVDPEEPAEEAEELGFWANLWAKILAFLNSIVEFFKNLF